MHFFYCPDIDTSAPLLGEQESHHCVKVLRLREGDPIQVADGKGNLFEATILNAHSKHCSFQIIQTTKAVGIPDFNLTMAVAPTKNIDRFEWFIEKAVELGVSEIIPVYCDHSERKMIKMDRIQSIMISALKQSLSAYLPTLHPMMPLLSFVSDFRSGSGNFIAHCYDLPKKPLRRISPDLNHYTICIGPEGDFSQDEVKMAIEAGFEPVSLGSRRLRTETAALYALQLIHFLKS